jgi:hypothetical protein
MLTLKEWLKTRKKKESKNERRSYQTGREVGHINHEREVARFDPPQLTQAVHLLSIAE